MADEPKKDEVPQNESDSLFNELKNRTGVEPALKIGLPDDDIGDSGQSGLTGTLEDRIVTGKKKSDMEVVDARLFPDLGFKHLNVMQVSRIFPDSFNPLLRIMVKSLIRHNLCAVERDKDGKIIMDENRKPKKKTRMSVAEAIAFVNTSLTIGIDGEGRIDEIHVFGRASETEETKAKNGLGI